MQDLNLDTNFLLFRKNYWKQLSVIKQMLRFMKISTILVLTTLLHVKCLAHLAGNVKLSCFEVVNFEGKKKMGDEIGKQFLNASKESKINVNKPTEGECLVSPFLPLTIKEIAKNIFTRCYLLGIDHKNSRNGGVIGNDAEMSKGGVKNTLTRFCLNSIVYRYLRGGCFTRFDEVMKKGEDNINLPRVYLSSIDYRNSRDGVVIGNNAVVSKRGSIDSNGIFRKQPEFSAGYATVKWAEIYKNTIISSFSKVVNNKYLIGCVIVTKRQNRKLVNNVNGCYKGSNYHLRNVNATILHRSRQTEKYVLKNVNYKGDNLFHSPLFRLL